MALTKVSRGLLSTGIVDNSTTTAITIDSSENVGINIAPTSYKLTVNSGATTATTAAAIGYNGDAGTNLYINTDHGNNLVSLYASGSASKEMRFLSGTLEVMRLDTSGNVGIGASSPSTKLHVLGGRSTFYSGDNYAVGVGNASGVLGGYMGSPAVNVLSFSEPGGVERMRIDSAGNVGIGTDSPTQEVEIKAASVPTLKLNQAGTYGAEIALRGNDLDIAGSANDIVFYTGGNNDVSTTERMRIDAGGSFLVGKTSLDVDVGTGIRIDADGALFASLASGNATYYIRSGASYNYYVLASGQIYSQFTSIASLSDERLKENVRDCEGLEKILQLQPRKFDWKAGHGKDIADDRGFIAQEIEQVFPELVGEYKESLDDDAITYKTVSQDLIPVLVKAIQEQQSYIQSQAAAITDLTTRLTALEKN